MFQTVLPFTLVPIPSTIPISAFPMEMAIFYFSVILKARIRMQTHYLADPILQVPLKVTFPLHLNPIVCFDAETPFLVNLPHSFILVPSGGVNQNSATRPLPIKPLASVNHSIVIILGS